MWRLLLAEVVVVALVAVVWLLGPLVGITSIAGRVGIIGVLLLPPAAMLIWTLIKQRKQAKELADGLAEQGEKQREQEARPDRKEEIDRLTKQFNEAVAALRASKLGKRGSQALYALPWYMIVGPPGAGKSTALSHSGLNFPYSTGQDPAVRGVGGTRNCDWWFSDQAVFLDTAGRYTLEEDDQEEWLAFLKLLKRNRARRPLNGLLVCVSIAELISQSPERVLETADTLRERLDEVLAELELVVPVYVLFSKCDLIPGFVESFGQMKRSTRGQVLGFTLPAQHKIGNLEETINHELELIDDSLQQYALTQLATVKPEQRPGVYQFPLQFAAAGKLLSRFLAKLLVANPYKETPRLRGVYFCSGTQEGHPVDQVMAAMGQSLGLRGATALPQQRTSPKSYFLSDLFTKVIIPDRQLAHLSSRGLAKRFRLRLVGMVCAFIAAAAIIGLSVSSYSKNSELVGSTVHLAKKRLGDVDDPAEFSESLEQLVAIADRLEQLSAFHEEGPPLSFRPGYSGEPLRDPLTRLFVRRMRKAFVTNAGEELEGTLEDIAQGSSLPSGKATKTAADRGKDSREASTGRSAPTDTLVNDYDLLKTYVMVTTPEHLDVSFAAAHLVEQWKKRLDPELHSRATLLNKAARAYLKLLKQGKARWLRADPYLVRDVRAILRARDVEYRRFVASAEKIAAPLTLRDVLKGRVQTVLVTTEKVPGIYTRKGFKLHMSAALEDGSAEPWVLGSDESADDLRKKLKKRYFRAYAAAWENFLRRLKLAPSDSAKDALQMLETLTEAPPLYQTLLSHVVYQTSLPEKNGVLTQATAAVESATDNKKKPPKGSVEATFLPLAELVNPPKAADDEPQMAGLKQYLDQLTTLRDEMAAFVANTDKPDTSKLDQVLSETFRVTKGILAPMPSGLRSRIGALLYAPLKDAGNQAGSASMTRTADAFATEVCEAFNEAIAGRYPFEQTTREALLQDAVDFFGPAGAAWLYFDSSLKDKLVRKGDRFTAKDSAKVPPHVIKFYSRAWLITRALFPRGASEPLIRFEVSPRPAVVKRGDHAISEITFELGGQKQTYRNGPLERWTFEWPNENSRARLIVRGAKGLREEVQFEGDWALKRLVDRARVRERKQWYEAVWSLKKGDIEIRLDFRPSRTENPLFDRLTLACS